VDDAEEVSVYDLVEVGDVGPEPRRPMPALSARRSIFPLILDYVVVKQAIEKK
jgi:hypothetical protein